MPISLTSPNVDNYYVGKGIVSVKFTDSSQGPTDDDYVDMGNVTSMSFTPKITKLDHFSSRQGIKKKDLSVATVLEAEIKMVAEEFTARNIQMALLASFSESPSGSNENVVLDIFTEPLRKCAFKFVGTNSVGPQWTFEFPVVVLTPTGALDTISDEWGKIELTGDVLADPNTGLFGTASCTFPASP